MCISLSVSLTPQDLIESIAAGDYPEWTLAIQTMELADEDKFDFDPLDVTKVGFVVVVTTHTCASATQTSILLISVGVSVVAFS